LVTFEKSQFAFPNGNVSGSTTNQELHIVPQTQSVRILEGSGTYINDILYCSGIIYGYDTTQLSGRQYIQAENVWATERNLNLLVSGRIYDGVCGGFSANNN